MFPAQAQACLLLQKSLHTRELRLCFKAPEWEQLMGQILAKVTEVTATGPPPPTCHQWLWEPGGKECGTPCLGRVWVCLGVCSLGPRPPVGGGEA